MLHQQDLQLKDVTRVASKLTDERDKISAVVKQEFVDRYLFYLLISTFPSLKVKIKISNS